MSVDVFDLWRRRFPDDDDTQAIDPRVDGDGPCRSCLQTFAWRGYDGLCGWCFEDLWQHVEAAVTP